MIVCAGVIENVLYFIWSLRVVGRTINAEELKNVVADWQVGMYMYMGDAERVDNFV